MQKITPFLWFNDQAEEAMNLYTSVFKNSKVVSATRNPAGAPGPEGAMLVGSIILDGQEFLLLNGGPQFTFSPAVSFVVDCKTQEEVDEFWEKLSEGGGEKQQCGWLKDRFGVSWQIVPSVMGQLMSSATPAQASRIMQAMMQMTKIDIAKLQEAFDQE